MYFQFPGILCTLLYSIAFLKFSVGVDTLFANQTLVDGQILTSQNQIFELGFFSPGASRNRFLGIWYRITPEVVVWVANRNNPINVSEVVMLSTARNGTLIISTPGSVIWSQNPSRVASNPVLQLLDTGNLVVMDMISESSPESYIWQSFDYLCDTRLPGMKMVDSQVSGLEKYLTSWRNSDDPSPGEFVFRIENQGLPDSVLFRGRMKWFRSGLWNGIYFGGIPIFPNPTFKPELVFNEDYLVSISDPYNSSIITRLTLSPSGLILRYTMNEARDRWNLVHTLPRDLCDYYAQCGTNGVCSITKEPICSCLRGFARDARRDLNSSGGCTRIRPLNCESGDGFLEVRSVKYPDMLSFWLNTSMSLDECRGRCLRNCSCTAYANAYETNGGYGCLMWYGDLVDIRESQTADSRQVIYIRLPVSELDNHVQVERPNRRPVKLIVILASVGAFVLCLICLAILVRIIIILKRRAAGKKSEDFELPLFKLATIAAATNNFSNENLLGEGGFGPVYKGTLLEGEEIAVKRLSETSGQGLEEFKNEVILIAKLQHRNLVRLLGCCVEGDERMLIYEYMQNRSLDYFVFGTDETRRTLLTWPKRFNIIMGIARGLLYLHHDSRLKVIHRDLKTSNILLDGNLNAKIADFGLARMFRDDQTTDRTKRVIGTYGYMAPEYATGGEFSIKSDIYSIGVVLLEIVSGKRNKGFKNQGHCQSLLGHAWISWNENKAMELMDESMNNTCVESQVKRCIQVGLLCVQKFAKDRPEMSSVVFMLASEGAILPEPKEPGFFLESSAKTDAEEYINRSTSKESTKCSPITITDIEPR